MAASGDPALPGGGHGGDRRYKARHSHASTRESPSDAAAAHTELEAGPSSGSLLLILATGFRVGEKVIPFRM